MLEIMYDIAPGATYKFNTGFMGEQVWVFLDDRPLATRGVDAFSAVLFRMMLNECQNKSRVGGRATSRRPGGAQGSTICPDCGAILLYQRAGATHTKPRKIECCGGGGVPSRQQSCDFFFFLCNRVNAKNGRASRGSTTKKMVMFFFSPLEITTKIARQDVGRSAGGLEYSSHRPTLGLPVGLKKKLRSFSSNRKTKRTCVIDRDDV